MNYSPTMRRNRRKGCRRNRSRRQNGGDGFAYRFGASVDPQNPGLGNAAEVIRFPSCENATRPGFDTTTQIRGGLPGFSGGRRSRRAQRGGRFTFGPEVVGSAGIALNNALYSGCGDGQYAAQNPLNKGDITTLLTAPPPLVANPTPMRGGFVGGVDSMVYQAPRAGYTQWPSDTAGGNAGTLADGKTPFEVNVPYSAQPTPSPACLKTGGGRRRSRKNRNRKNRKSRKSRCWSRKN